MARKAFLIGFCCALGACSTEHAPEPVSIALPATLGPSEARWPDRQWWQGFGNPELTTLVGQALAANADIEAALARIDQARARLRMARAPLLPAVNLSADGMRQGANSSSGAMRGNFAYAEVAASWEADIWGRLRAQSHSARASLAASQFDADAVRLGIEAQVADGWLSLVELRERRAIASDDLASARDLLAQAEARQHAGTAFASDVAAQRVVLAQAQAMVAALDRAQTDARASLAILLGRPAQGFDINATGLDAIQVPPLSTPGLPAELLARRPDVASAEARLQAAGEDVRAAHAAMLPRITLSASGGGQIGTGPSEALYNLMAGLAQPLFDHGTLAGGRDLAVGQRREREADYRKAVLTALGDVERSLKVVAQLDQEEKARAETVDDARAAFDQIRARYHAGKEDMVSVLTAQRTLFDTRGALAAARAERLRAFVSLYQTLGGGWTSPAKA